MLKDVLAEVPPLYDLETSVAFHDTVPLVGSELRNVSSGL